MLDPNSIIHIVGGTGAMGTWLRKFLESLGYFVSVSDEKNKVDSLKEADIIFISVPINLAGKVILETAKKTKADCLIIDLSSIKSKTKDALKSCKRDGLSLHFLFGPSISSIQNQKIVFEDLSKSEKSRELIKLFKEQGAQVFEMESKKHDFIMAHIQALTHFVNLCLAKILIENKIGISGEISTPVFLSQISSTLRVLSQNPRLLSEIQVLNPEFSKIAGQFIEIAEELADEIDSKSISKIEREFKELAGNLESISGRLENKQKEKSTERTSVKNLRVGYLGPKGTFSNQAVLAVFDEKENQLQPAKNIYELFENLSGDIVDLIVAPYENTIEGTVRETLDLLFDYDLKVIGKIDLEISQNLLSKEKNINSAKRIISHPQAINQSRDFLDENLPNAVIETSPSTVPLSELEKPGVAIIGSKLAAKIYKLNILKEDIQKFSENVTRFYVISKKDFLNLPGRTKTLLFLSVFNRVGILRDILSIFADLSINLNKIESRPSKEKNWDYYFFIELEITDEDTRLEQALNILKQYCPKISVLGKL